MWRTTALLVALALCWKPCAGQMDQSLCVGRCGGLIIDFNTPNLAPLCSCKADCDSSGIKCCDGANAACNKQWNNFNASLSCAAMSGCGKTGISNDDSYCRCDATCVFDSVPGPAAQAFSVPPPNECCNDLFACNEFTVVELPCACSYDCLFYDRCCADLSSTVGSDFPEAACCPGEGQTCPYALPLPSQPEGCPADQLQFIFMIKPDRQPREIFWTLKQTQDVANNSLNAVLGEGDARFGIMIDLFGATLPLEYIEFVGTIVSAGPNEPAQLHAVTSGLACLGPGTYQFQIHDPNGFYTNENGRGGFGLLIQNSADPAKNDVFLYSGYSTTFPEINVQFSIIPSEDDTVKNVTLANEPCSLSEAFIDCNGRCFSNVFLNFRGDGVCDLGTLPGLPNLMCKENFFDNGDCYDNSIFGFPPSPGLPPPPPPLISYGLDSTPDNQTFEGSFIDPSITLPTGELIQGASITFDEDFGRNVLSCESPQSFAQIPLSQYGSSGSFSISFWFKMDPGSLSGPFHFILSHGTSAVDQQNNLHVFFPGSLSSSYGIARTSYSNSAKFAPTFNFLDTDGLTPNTGSFIGTRRTWGHPNLEDGKWHMYTFAGGLLGGFGHYIDGKIFGLSFDQGIGAFLPSTNLFLCTRSDFNPDRFWTGRISDLKIYDSALFPPQVFSEYLASRPGASSDPPGCDGVPGSMKEHDSVCAVCGGESIFPIAAPESAVTSNPFTCCRPSSSVSGQFPPSIVDVLLIVNHLANKAQFQFNSANPCALVAADISGDGIIDVADVLSLLNQITTA